MGLFDRRQISGHSIGLWFGIMFKLIENTVSSAKTYNIVLNNLQSLSLLFTVTSNKLVFDVASLVESIGRHAGNITPEPHVLEHLFTPFFRELQKCCPGNIVFDGFGHELFVLTDYAKQSGDAADFMAEQFAIYAAKQKDDKKGLDDIPDPVAQPSSETKQ